MSFAHEVPYGSQEALDAALAAVRDKYRKVFAPQIREGLSQGLSELQSMDEGVNHSKVMTPGENREYRWAFAPLGSEAKAWRKWGGGNKMGSAGASVNSARRARADARRSAPDANVNNYVNKNLFDRIGLTPVSNFLDSRLNDVQGKFVTSNPSDIGGFSQKTLNEAGARGADPSFAGEAGRNVYGGDMTGSTPSIGSYGTSFSNFTGGLPSFNDQGSFLSNFGRRADFSTSMGSLIAGDPNRGLNRTIQYGRDGAPDDIKSITTDSDFGKRMREAVLGRPIQAFVPRMAGIFAV